MTKRELSKELNISPSRISQLMKELSLQEVTDYTWKSSSKGQAEIHFTASGIGKIRNRPKRLNKFEKVNGMKVVKSTWNETEKAEFKPDPIRATTVKGRKAEMRRNAQIAAYKKSVGRQS